LDYTSVKIRSNFNLGYRLLYLIHEVMKRLCINRQFRLQTFIPLLDSLQVIAGY